LNTEIKPQQQWEKRSQQNTQDKGTFW
jgi:hypothetical protein